VTEVYISEQSVHVVMSAYGECILGRPRRRGRFVYAASGRYSQPCREQGEQCPHPRQGHGGGKQESTGRPKRSGTRGGGCVPQWAPAIDCPRPKPCLSRSRAHDPHPHHCRPRHAPICCGLGSCSTGTVHEGRGIVQSTCCARCDHVWSRTSGDLQSEFYAASTSAEVNLRRRSTITSFSPVLYPGHLSGAFYSRGYPLRSSTSLLLSTCFSPSLKCNCSVSCFTSGLSLIQPHQYYTSPYIYAPNHLPQT
jgi:hypothetical protein